MEEECGAAGARGFLRADRVARAIQQRGVKDQKPVADTWDSSLSWCKPNKEGLRWVGSSCCIISGPPITRRDRGGWQRWRAS
eukprot:4360209-Prymnesium_polylepis.1